MNDPNEDSQFISTHHDVTEEELNKEKNNILKFPTSNKDTEVALNLEQIYFPIFRYERFKLKHLSDQPKVPYGECFTCQFNDAATNLACGYSNGFVNVFDLVDKKEPIKFRVSETPITSLKWNEKRKGILIVGSTDGKVSHWHAKSGKSLSEITEENNSINCVDYSFDYAYFLTGGNDFSIKIYDDTMKTKIQTLKATQFEKPNDIGRVFCAKYMPNTTSTIYSGGWDRTIRFYDTRTGNICNTITGPEICGDSLDVSGETLASGSWSTKDQIQLWDIRTLKCI